MSFDLFGPGAPAPIPAPDSEIEVAARRRRALLGVHQIFGIGTLVTMAATTVVGQLSYSDLYGGPGTAKYLWPHRIGMGVVTLEFATAGALAMLAPEPYEAAVADRGFSTATVHKTATSLATVGMLTQLGLGFATARKADAGNPHGLDSLARAHQIVGYSTLGLLVVAASAWIF
jgi:hypothetical protein